jgi:hypothetical protein
MILTKPLEIIFRAPILRGGRGDRKGDSSRDMLHLRVTKRALADVITAGQGTAVSTASASRNRGLFYPARGSYRGACCKKRSLSQAVSFWSFFCLPVSGLSCEAEASIESDSSVSETCSMRSGIGSTTFFRLILPGCLLLARCLALTWPCFETRCSKLDARSSKPCPHCSPSPSTRRMDHKGCVLFSVLSYPATLTIPCSGETCSIGEVGCDHMVNRRKVSPSLNPDHFLQTLARNEDDLMPCPVPSTSWPCKASGPRLSWSSFGAKPCVARAWERTKKINRCEPRGLKVGRDLCP